MAKDRPHGVLVITDDTSHRDPIEAAFGGRGSSIEVVSSCAAGLERLRNAGESRPGLIIVDLNTPGMEPGELVEHIKSDDALRLLPVVTVADAPPPEHIARVYNAHGAGVLVRPDDTDAYVNALGAVASYWLDAMQLPDTSTFVAAQATATYMEALPPETRPARGGRLTRILLLEDRETETLALLRALDQGHRRFVIEHARRLNEARLRLSSASVDLIVADLDVADSKGLTTVVRLLADTVGTPIVALCQDPLVAEEAVRLGAEDAVPRQADSSELVRAIQHALIRRELLTARIKKERVNAVSQLAGGVGHGFNNLLTVVDGYSTLIHDIVDDEEVKSYADEIRATVHRAEQLTRHLLIYGRRQAFVPQVIDLNEFLTEQRDALSELAKPCGLHIERGDDVPVIFADRDAMGVVIENLVRNASEAMPDGGTITVSTRSRRVSPIDVRPMVGSYEGDFVGLSVRDEGAGIDASTLRNMWMPFFTTKHRGRGSGLGLPTVEGIVAQHRGWVEVVTVPDHGTAFDVALPVTERSRQSADAGHRAVSGETVLVVDPIMIIRHAICVMLKSHGYEALQAEDGQQALNQLTAHGDVDVLITDMAIPGGMGGIELLRMLRRMPDYPEVLFFSGYPQDLIEFDENTNLTRRPYQSQDLLRQVARASEVARQRRR